MEANPKRRGFVKSKLMPLYRSAKTTSSISNVYISSTKVKPSQASPPATSVGYAVQPAHQDYLISLPKQKVSYIIPPDNNNSTNNNNNKLSHFDKLFGVAVDEHVDTKAASYISAVQERFKLEPINSE